MDEQKTVSPAPQPPPEDDVAKGKGMAWLSYLGILWLIPLLTMKENSFAKFHVKQGIVLDIFTVGIAIVMGILAFIIIGFVIGPIGFAIILVLRIIGIIRSLQGKYWKCPMGVSALAEKFKF
jgi:uncharacterized membrane protein